MGCTGNSAGRGDGGWDGAMEERVLESLVGLNVGLGVIVQHLEDEGLELVPAPPYWSLLDHQSPLPGCHLVIDSPVSCTEIGIERERGELVNHSNPSENSILVSETKLVSESLHVLWAPIPIIH